MSSRPFSSSPHTPRLSLNPTIRRLMITQSVQKSQLQTVEITSIGKPGESLVSEQQSDLEDKWRSSLFALGSETAVLSFGSETKRTKLTYKILKGESRLVRSILTEGGLEETEGEDWSIMWSNTSLKYYQYDGLSPFQSVNHFPSSSELTRKDRLCISVSEMQDQFGKEHFDFLPETYLLPEEFAEFYQDFKSSKGLWIVKPSSSSRGRGIYLVDNIKDVPVEERCVISRYIQDPFLINGLKFDMRLYVLIRSFEPLKIYMYNEGLARFASEPYNTNAKENRFCHLTNYSVNKKNDKYVQNADLQQDNIGHKWSLKALDKHLEKHCVDTQLLWSRIYDVIIKSVLSVESSVVESLRRQGIPSNSCFELLGFDILIDSSLKPWLLEVNLSPSLATDSPLDLHTKQSLLTDTFNLIGIRRNPLNLESPIKRRKRGQVQSLELRPQFFQSQKFRQVFKETLEEYNRKGNFLRIFPALGSDYYEQFFRRARLINKALYQALFLEMPEVSHVERPASNGNKTNGYSIKYRKTTASQNQAISGDSLLIEYVERAANIIKKIPNDRIQSEWTQSIHNFCCHFAWKREIHKGELWQMLELRLNEMKEKTKSQGKSEALKKFSAEELEKMLRGSPQKIAQDVIKHLVGAKTGLLSSLLKSFELLI